MAGCVHRHDPQRAKPELSAVVCQLEVELVGAARGSDDPGSGRCSDLVRPGDVVVVNVRLEDVADVGVEMLRLGEEAPGVALRVDKRRLAAGGEQVAVIAEPGCDEEFELHNVILSKMRA